MADTRLSFKEMCARFDVTPRTLRYYEYIELLSPEKEGRARFYGPREIARMTLILRGRRFGFGLEEIRQWLLIYETSGTSAQMQALVDLADRQLVELNRQKADLEGAIEELQSVRDAAAHHMQTAGTAPEPSTRG
jgi:DNA-binding transcriptional MerR regulator